MSLIALQTVMKSFGGDPVISAVTLAVESGNKIGLVGPNGSGKSTLMDLLAGISEATEGRIDVQRGLVVAHAAQILEADPEQSAFAVAREALASVQALEAELRALEGQMADERVAADPTELERVMQRYAQVTGRFEQAGGYELDARVRAALMGLGLTEADITRPVGRLSGGQRARVSLARALLSAPDLLLLDEPTNHLDLDGIEWLEGFLREWPGPRSAALVVVSHDRYFLDAICNRIWEVEAGRVYAYSGDYTSYWRQRAERRRQAAEAHEAAVAERERLQQFVEKWRAGTRARQAQSRAKQLEKLEVPPGVADERGGPSLRLGAAGRTGREVLLLDDVAHAYGEKPILTGIDAVLERGQRVGVVGPNGSGKTTLLRLIMGELQPQQGRVAQGIGVKLGYLAQERYELAPEWRVIDALLASRHMTDGEARSWLARFLFRGEEVFKLCGVLSGGERARLELARILIHEPNVLILDEPTNHLDAAAAEALEAALLEFDGTLLFVSHDRYFVERVADHLWWIEEGGLTPVEGGYSRLRELRRAAREAAKATASQNAGLEARPSEPERTPRAEPHAANRAQARPALSNFQRQRRLEAVEAAIERVESDLAALEARLADPELYTSHDEAQETARRHKAALEERDRLYSEWEGLASQ